MCFYVLLDCLALFLLFFIGVCLWFNDLVLTYNSFSAGCTWLRCTDTTSGLELVFPLQCICLFAADFCYFLQSMCVAAPVVPAAVICNCFSRPPEDAGIPLSLYLYLCICVFVFLSQILFAIVSGDYQRAPSSFLEFVFVYLHIDCTYYLQLFPRPPEGADINLSLN